MPTPHPHPHNHPPTDPATDAARPARRGLRFSDGVAVTVALLWSLTVCRSASVTETNTFLASWLAAQTNLQSWSADVTQTRTLKTLTHPLVTQGRIWFVAPNRFRWELGDPPQTIAIRQPEQMLVIYPRLKRVERFPLNTDQPAPWKDTLSLLEAGFPGSAAELESRFKILGQTHTHDVMELRLEPRATSARRLMPEITLMISVPEGFLRATELQFADGSRLRNDFTNALRNPTLSPGLFNPEIPPTYRVTEPGAKSR